MQIYIYIKHIYLKTIKQDIWRWCYSVDCFLSDTHSLSTHEVRELTLRIDPKPGISLLHDLRTHGKDPSPLASYPVRGLHLLKGLWSDAEDKCFPQSFTLSCFTPGARAECSKRIEVTVCVTALCFSFLPLLWTNFLLTLHRREYFKFSSDICRGVQIKETIKTILSLGWNTLWSGFPYKDNLYRKRAIALLFHTNGGKKSILMTSKGNQLLVSKGVGR